MVNANSSKHHHTVLLLNIGNTNAEAALLKDDILELCSSFSTKTLETSPENFPEILTANCSIPWIVSSVVPVINTFLSSVQKKENLIFIKAEMTDDIDFSKTDSTTLGADRVANLAAAVELEIAPAIIVDCGTAITVEIINSERLFLGGAILPGREMMHHALADNTGQLPCISHNLRRPQSAPGKNTTESIKFGIDTGLIGAVKHILQAISNTYPWEPAFTKIVTGGDRDYFGDNIAGLEKAPRDFTMQGLAHIARRLL